MVLDIAKYFQNLIKKEMKVSHFNGTVSVGKAEKFKKIYKKAIQRQYGESFLQDANYIAIFQQDAADTSSMKNLFNLVNRALGKDANNMTQADFKSISLEDQDSADDTDVDDTDVDNTDVDDTADDSQLKENEEIVKSFVFMKITVK